MTQPLIGLTTYGRNQAGRHELPAEYSEAVFRAGAIPVMLPPIDGDALAAAWLDRLDGVILTGGGDLDPSLYDGTPHHTIYNLDPARDASEAAVTRAALRRTVPLLAICRGLQVLNVVLGGTLYEHLPDAVGEQVAHRLPPRETALHRVQVDAGTRLAEILGVAQTEVVSWHHQGIRMLGSGLKPTAYAPDGVIEAVELPEHPWCIAVQWHPELSAAEDPVQQRLFDALAQAANAG